VCVEKPKRYILQVLKANAAETKQKRKAKKAKQ